jgi:hypothetical protein
VAVPPGVACPAGATVRLTVYLAGKQLARRRATVDGSCAYRLSLTLPARAAGRKVLVKARFEGRDDLLARVAPARTVTVRR